MQEQEGFFLGIDTLAKKRKFIIFHAYMIVVATIISGIIIFIYRWHNIPTDMLYRMGLPMPSLWSISPFTDMSRWLWLSLFVWNMIGAMRFSHVASKVAKGFGGVIEVRFIVIICMFFFPIVYLYNLWCLIVKKESKKVRERNQRGNGDEL